MVFDFICVELHDYKCTKKKKKPTMLVRRRVNNTKTRIHVDDNQYIYTYIYLGRVVSNDGMDMV